MVAATSIAPEVSQSGTDRSRPLALSRWLLAVAALVIAILVVGGITRLTESGVSITEWRPVTGAIPPLNHAQWQAEFDAYRLTPQYTEINGPAGMTLADYKFIFLWEWVHRFLARLFGLALALPLAWFWVRRQIPAGYKLRLLALLALGGFQGALGWWMVESGIVNDVRVSHFRLAAHLLTALTTLAGLIWTALDLRGTARGEASARMSGIGALALAALALQLCLGAFVAGLRAGHVANDWPLMMGQFFPEGVDWSQGAVHALLYDPYLVHFVHRWWAWVVLAVLIVLARRLRQQGARPPSIAIHSAVGTQILLGIATVLSGVTLWVAVLHQLVGALLLAATTWGAHAVGRRP